MRRPWRLEYRCNSQSRRGLTEWVLLQNYASKEAAESNIDHARWRLRHTRDLELRIVERAP